MFGLRLGLNKFKGDFVIQNNEYNENSIFDRILQYIKKNVDYYAASLLLLNKNCNKLQQVAKYGDGCNLINDIHFKMGIGLSGWIAQKKRTVCLPDIHRGARHGHHPIRSFVAIPILHQDNVIGVLNLAHVIPNAYGPKEVKTLKNLISTIAPKIYNLLNSYERDIRK